MNPSDLEFFSQVDFTAFGGICLGDNVFKGLTTSSKLFEIIKYIVLVSDNSRRVCSAEALHSRTVAGLLERSMSMLHM